MSNGLSWTSEGPGFQAEHFSKIMASNQNIIVKMTTKETKIMKLVLISEEQAYKHVRTGKLDPDSWKSQCGRACEDVPGSGLTDDSRWAIKKDNFVTLWGESCCVCVTINTDHHHRTVQTKVWERIANIGTGLIKCNLHSSLVVKTAGYLKLLFIHQNNAESSNKLPGLVCSCLVNVPLLSCSDNQFIVWQMSAKPHGLKCQSIKQQGWYIRILFHWSQARCSRCGISCCCLRPVHYWNGKYENTWACNALCLLRLQVQTDFLSCLMLLREDGKFVWACRLLRLRPFWKATIFFAFWTLIISNHLFSKLQMVCCCVDSYLPRFTAVWTHLHQPVTLCDYRQLCWRFPCQIRVDTTLCEKMFLCCFLPYKQGEKAWHTGLKFSPSPLHNVGQTRNHHSAKKSQMPYSKLTPAPQAMLITLFNSSTLWWPQGKLLALLECSFKIDTVLTHFSSISPSLINNIYGTSSSGRNASRQCMPSKALSEDPI